MERETIFYNFHIDHFFPSLCYELLQNLSRDSRTVEETRKLSGKRADGYLDRLYKFLMNGRRLLKLRRNQERRTCSDCYEIMLSTNNLLLSIDPNQLLLSWISFISYSLIYLFFFQFCFRPREQRQPVPSNSKSSTERKGVASIFISISFLGSLGGTGGEVKGATSGAININKNLENQNFARANDPRFVACAAGHQRRNAMRNRSQVLVLPSPLSNIPCK